RHQVFPEVLRIVTQYVDQKVRFAQGVDRRELALEKYVQKLRQRVREGILPAAASRDAPLVPIVNSFQPSVSTANVNYRTARPVVSLTKSHLNLAPVYSDWEEEAIEIFEFHDWPKKIDEIRAVTSKPVWVSEAGASSFGAEEVQL